MGRILIIYVVYDVGPSKAIKRFLHLEDHHREGETFKNERTKPKDFEKTGYTL